MNRFLIGLFITITVAMVGLAAYYPEDFALALGAFVLGSTLGGVASYYAFTSIHDRGFERSQQLSLKQVSDPAKIMREQRLQDQLIAKSAPGPNPKQHQSKSKPIPQFNITGLDN